MTVCCIYFHAFKCVCYVYIIIPAKKNHSVLRCNINAWMLTDIANTYCIYMHVYIQAPPLPMTTDITLCILQLSYKWTHYSRQEGKLNQAHSFIFIFLRSHTAFSPCLHSCAALCVCAFMCRVINAWRKFLIDQPQPQWWMKVPSSFGCQHDRRIAPWKPWITLEKENQRFPQLCREVTLVNIVEQVAANDWIKRSDFWTYVYLEARYTSPSES